MNTALKRFFIFLTLALMLLLAFLAYRLYSRLYPQPRIDDSPTTIIGFNHVGINVLDLDKMLAFYQKATGYELLERTVVANDEAADELFGQKGISYESAILKGPNMLLELREFANQQDTLLKKMPPQGPGITHTCYQSAMTASGFARFKEAGAEILTRGGAPVDLGGYGVTYAYAYDPEGNMLELEQMSERLIRLQIGTEWARQHPLWMTQVAIISPDLQRLVAFYQRVLGIKPYRMGSYAHNPGFDKIANLDSLAFDAAWFGMDGQGKKLELMQYVHPPTPPNPPPRALTAPGYTFSFEVLDIQQEYERLKKLGVRFVSTPQVLGPFRTVFAYDVDGNVFALRQALQDTSIYSLQNF